MYFRGGAWLCLAKHKSRDLCDIETKRNGIQIFRKNLDLSTHINDDGTKAELKLHKNPFTSFGKIFLTQKFRSFLQSMQMAHSPYSSPSLANLRPPGLYPDDTDVARRPPLIPSSIFKRKCSGEEGRKDVRRWVRAVADIGKYVREHNEKYKDDELMQYRWYDESLHEKDIQAELYRLVDDKAKAMISMLYGEMTYNEAQLRFGTQMEVFVAAVASDPICDPLTQTARVFGIRSVIISKMTTKRRALLQKSKKQMAEAQSRQGTDNQTSNRGGASRQIIGINSFSGTARASEQAIVAATYVPDLPAVAAVLDVPGMVEVSDLPDSAAPPYLFPNGASSDRENLSNDTDTTPNFQHMNVQSHLRHGDTQIQKKNTRTNLPISVTNIPISRPPRTGLRSIRGKRASASFKNGLGKVRGRRAATSSRNVSDSKRATKPSTTGESSSSAAIGGNELEKNSVEHEGAPSGQLVPSNITSATKTSFGSKQILSKRTHRIDTDTSDTDDEIRELQRQIAEKKKLKAQRKSDAKRN